MLLYSLHCLHNTTLYVYINIYICMCMWAPMCAHNSAMTTISLVLYMHSTREERERETTARLLPFFLSSSSSFIFYSTSTTSKHTHTFLLSLIRCENKNNCIFSSCSIFADKLFSDQLFRRASIECDSDWWFW